MWVLSWKKYGASKLATFVSVIGALTRYGGVICLFSSLIPAGIICLAIGIGIHFGAEAINKAKVKKLIGKVNAPAPAPVQPPVAQPTAPVQPAAPVAPAAPAAPAQPVMKEKQCLRCGNGVAPGQKFCGQCGYEIKW